MVAKLNSFIFTANQELTQKSTTQKKAANEKYQRIIKELTDPERKFFQAYVQNPVNDDRASALLTRIEVIQAKDFISNRDFSCWKSIKRWLSNWFKGRTSSNNVIETIKINPQSPFSPYHLAKVNPCVKQLLKKLPEEKRVTEILTDNLTQADTPINRQAKLPNAAFSLAPENCEEEIEKASCKYEMKNIWTAAKRGDNSRNETHKLNNGYAFALYEGQGTEDTRKYLSSHLLPRVNKELTDLKDLSEQNIYNALTRSFVSCNRDWLNSEERIESAHIALSGATACVAVIINNELWIVNAGNSRAVLVDDFGVMQLSDDAVAKNDRFAKLVESRGGAIHNGMKSPTIQGQAMDDEGKWSPNFGNALAQSFGNFSTKGVAVNPMITKVPLDHMGESAYLVLGTHAIFEAATSEEVADYLRSNSEIHVAEGLVSKAINAHDLDEQAYEVMVIQLKKK